MPFFGKIYRMSHELRSLLWRSVPYVKIYRYNPKPPKLRWSRGSMLAFSTQVRGFKPGQSRRIFKGKKSSARLLKEVKPSAPCCRFAACKRSLKWRGSRHFGKITGQHSRPQFPLPQLGSLTSWRTCRHLVVKSGNV